MGLGQVELVVGGAVVVVVVVDVLVVVDVEVVLVVDVLDVVVVVGPVLTLMTTTEPFRACVAGVRGLRRRRCPRRTSRSARSWVRRAEPGLP